jgi:hypothetical protein
MKNPHGQHLQHGRHAEKQEAAEGAKPGSGSTPDQRPGAAASRESNRQKSTAERRHKRI